MTLVFMAAGLGTRFQGGIKQLEKIGPHKETIMELILKDSKRINKVVFIIRKELKELFERELIPNISLPYEFVFQDISINRKKPFGTGHALLCLKGVVKEDFILLNADDYIKKEAIEVLCNHFQSKNHNHAVILFRLKNTFISSDKGNRGICEVKNNQLLQIKNIPNIEKKENKFLSEENEIDGNLFTSMNVWGFHPSIFPYFETKFEEFLKTANLEIDEFGIPTVINQLLEKEISITSYLSEQICLGITYQEDVLKFQKEMC